MVKFVDKKHGFYNENEAIVTSVEDPTKKAIRFILAAKPKKILDVGCGDGIIGKEIMKITRAEVYGVDISETAAQLALKNGINAMVCDVSKEQLPWGEDFFDVIYWGQNIEHLVDPDFTIAEFWRILKPGGKLVITTPNLASWLNRILLLFGIQPSYSEVSTKAILGRRFLFLGQYSRPAGHLRLYTLLALRDFLVLHGFRIQAVRGAMSPSIQGRRHILLLAGRILDKLFSFWPSLSSDLVVVAMKKTSD